MDRNPQSPPHHADQGEGRFRSIFEFARTGLVYTDREGKILECNQTFQNLVGYTQSELQRMNFWDLSIPEDRPSEGHLVNKLANGETKSYHLEKRCLTKNGSHIWVDVNLSVVQDPTVQTAYLVINVDDISERKRTEERLRILSRAVESSPVSIVITNQEGAIEYANPFFTQLTGYDPAEAFGRNPRILKSGHTQPDVYARMWRTILSGQIWEGEFINRKKNGDLYAELALIAPVLDDQGKISHFVAIKEDITERKSAQEALMKQNQTLQALLEVTLDIAKASGSRNLLNRIMHNAVNLLDANQGGSIILHDTTLDQLKVVEGSGINQNIVGLTFPADRGVSGLVFRTGKSLIVTDYASWEGHYTPPEAEVPGTVIGVPLRVEGQVIGVLTLFADSLKRTFSQQDVEVAEMFAAQAAVAYQNIQLYERTQKELGERQLAEAREREQRNLAEALQEITGILNTSLELDDVLDQILQTVERVVPYDAINIMLLEEGAAHTVRSRSKDHNLQKFSTQWVEPVAENLIFRQIVESKEVVVLRDTRQHPGWSIPGIEWIQSYLGAPIIVDGEVHGFVNLGSQMPGFYNQEYARRMKIFAAQAALALQNAGTFAQVQFLAVNDPMLNIFNRRGLIELGRREIERVKRFNRPISALFLDIDHFKRINDTYQHKIGDEVLTCISELMRKYVREVDIVGRYGGEEFVILLPEIDLEGAVIVAERLRHGVENLRIPSEYGMLFVTISIGVAELGSVTGIEVKTEADEINLLNDLLERANKMLHIAKENGRNRVITEPARKT